MLSRQLKTAEWNKAKIKEGKLEQKPLGIRNPKTDPESAEFKKLLAS